MIFERHVILANNVVNGPVPVVLISNSKTGDGAELKPLHCQKLQKSIGTYRLSGHFAVSGGLRCNAQAISQCR